MFVGEGRIPQRHTGGLGSQIEAEWSAQDGLRKRLSSLQYSVIMREIRYNQAQIERAGECRII